MIATIAKRSAWAAVALAFAACTDDPSGPAATFDKATIDADLKEMSLKIKAFGAPGAPDGGMDDGGGFEAFKRSAARGVAACEQDGKVVEVYTDTSAGIVGTSYDTTETYTAAGKLVCALEDEAAYTLTRSYYRNSQYESWISTRSDMPDLTAIFAGNPFTIKLTGSGRVHYFSDYEFEVKSIDFSMKISMAGAISDVVMKMNLSLDGGRYTVPLDIGPGMDLTSDEEPGPNEVVFLGPIQQNGTTVGWFEVMGDDRVVIKDSSKNIIQVH